MAKYLPEIAAEGRLALAKMRRLVPGAVELVYDNYNGLVIGFCPGERASEGVFSLVLFPHPPKMSAATTAARIGRHPFNRHTNKALMDICGHSS